MTALEWGLVAAGTLRYGVATASAAFGEAVGELGGTLNVGLEGCLLFGAYAAFAVGASGGSPVAAFFAGGLAGLAATAGLGLFTIRGLADAVVAGTALNLLAAGLAQVMFKRRTGTTGGLVTVERLPAIGPVDVGVITLLIGAAVVWWLLKYRAFGALLRAAGEAPHALTAAGRSVAGMRWAGLLTSGLFAGLGGAYLVVGVTGSFSPGIVGGRGFIALAMVAFGRWRPVAALFAALFVAALEGLQFFGQAGGGGLPPQLWSALPAATALAVLLFAGKTNRAPSGLGVPYTKGR